MRQNGTVKFFNQSKGFGFITPDDGGKDVFVHITAVEHSDVGALTENMRVSFETEPDKRGKGPKGGQSPSGRLRRILAEHASPVRATGWRNSTKPDTGTVLLAMCKAQDLGQSSGSLFSFIRGAWQ